MQLSYFDWIIIVLFLGISLTIGLYFRKRGGKSLADYFLTGRNLPWYIAGISMVATTFAADTPLAVTELVAQGGVSGNWVWWNMLIGGMLTTFFFAKYWRKAEVLTELEFIELRYGGKPASFLRGFKSVYLGVFMNCIIIAWVNLAMISILQVFFDVPSEYLIWIVAGIMAVTVVYSALSGLWGVAVTDAVQFVIAMAASIILAVIVLNVDEIGGIAGLKSKLPSSSFNFFPSIGDAGITGTLTISIGAFLAFAGFQWWASWYPGAEPGGGGYVAQRMMSCKNEKHSVFATLFFQIAHYCLRPWPWIIVGLAALVLYPELGETEKRLGYVMAMNDYLPAGLRGLMLTAFLAAYMSTISTQLNWGSSYLVNDLYKRFLKPENKFLNVAKANKHYVGAGRLFTVLLMIIALFVTTLIETISGVWLFIIECGAGLGLVLILRWYWWRINAYSEIVATIVPFAAYAFSNFYLVKVMPESFVLHRGPFFFTVGITTVSWIVATYLTKPERIEVLSKFYEKVQPDGAWKMFRIEKSKSSNQIFKLILCWLSGVVMTYSMLFATGKIIFGEYTAAFYWIIAALISLFALLKILPTTKILKG
ncbi:MAG: Na+:solute symporter [Bacteroidetes bacterium]|nr:Na+:solute symporter [Bacteroidota bacterium]